MQTAAITPAARERRQFDRYPCPHRAQTFVEHAWRDCAVDDISAGGALVQTSLRPAVGQPVMLFVENVAEMPAVVVRHTEDGIALRFDFTTRLPH